MSKNKVPAPRHLRPETAKWFRSVCAEYVLEAHHVRLLRLAAEAWDRCEKAREVLDREGVSYRDRFDCPRARPEVAIERDSRIAFSRLIRELDLDTSLTPDPSRPPAISSNRR